MYQYFFTTLYALRNIAALYLTRCDIKKPTHILDGSMVSDFDN